MYIALKIFKNKTFTLPKGARPSCSGAPVPIASARAHWAHGVSQVDVKVKYLTPKACKALSTPNDPPRACPPSTPTREHTLPAAWASLISVTKLRRLG